MRNTELSEMLDTTPQKIADKKASTNKLTSIMARVLLSMPKSMVEPFVGDAMAEYEKVEDRNDKRRADASTRAKAIGKDK